MSTIEHVANLFGKVIEWAGIVSDEAGDAEFVMRFTDGTSATVGAWQKEGHSIEMTVEVSTAKTRESQPEK